MYKTPFISAVFAVFLSLSALKAHAENLPDPTRPPLFAESPNAPAAGEAQADQGLQSILLSPGYKAAIINGRQVRVGDRIDESKVLEIRAGEVVLQKGAAREVLKLYPTMRKPPFSRKKR